MARRTNCLSHSQPRVETLMRCKHRLLMVAANKTRATTTLHLMFRIRRQPSSWSSAQLATSKHRLPVGSGQRRPRRKRWVLALSKQWQRILPATGRSSIEYRWPPHYNAPRACVRFNFWKPPLVVGCLAPPLPPLIGHQSAQARVRQTDRQTDGRDGSAQLE